MPERSSVRLVDTAAVCNPITGGVGQSVDGQTVASGDSVLLPSPPNGLPYAGVWVAAAGAWARRADWDELSEMLPGDSWRVEEGNIYAGSRWQFDGPTPTTLNTDAIVIGSWARRRSLEAGTGLAMTGTTPPFLGQAPTGVGDTTYQNVTSLTVTAAGTIKSLTTGALGTAYIEGLGMQKATASTFTVRSGAAYIPALARTTELSADTTVNIGTTAVQALRYVYLYDTNGVGQIQVSTTAPDVPYFGSARTMLGDSTRRYLGMVRTNSSAGEIIEFDSEVFGGSSVLYIYGGGTNNSDQVALDAVSVSTTQVLASIGPSSATAQRRLVSPAARTATLYVERSGASDVFVGQPINTFGTAPYQIFSTQASVFLPPMRLTTAQELYYHTFSGTATLSLWVLSYFERR